MERRHDVLTSDLCAEIDDLTERLITAEKRAEHWQKKYADLQNESLKHSETMVGNILGTLLDKASKTP